MIHNLFCFHGVDHKVGTTMVSQSIAEAISLGSPNLKLLFISMNGRESAEYVKETPVSIDAMKFHIDNKMINGSDFMKTCSHKGNFYMMAGISNELEARYYYPDMARYLLEEIAPEFDLILADCGNEIDNGLAIGALSSAEEIFLVATQQETGIRRFEKNKRIMENLGIAISACIINKYYEQDPIGLSYLAGRMEIEKERLWKLNTADYSRQAEMEYKTLLEYRNEAYTKDIVAVANYILRKNGFEEFAKQRKSRWKSFI
ncbi:septum site-determining protein MinD [Anoxybacterium hadale]|uniref:Septum site-determining protein MinD n=1 Tax=Anoxybacterium hadale TaxID=3408580 RepID=A0ACD1A7W8_9FIRM|nr:septum site-determining protein MinD [Clostridiales bacterium]